MLVLCRNINESIDVICPDSGKVLSIKILEVQGKKVKLGIVGDKKDFVIHRDNIKIKQNISIVNGNHNG